jgi:hypothetical protein
MKITATKGAYSSVTGQSVILRDGKGVQVCQLAILNPYLGDSDHKTVSEFYAEVICDKINRKSRDPKE